MTEHRKRCIEAQKERMTMTLEELMTSLNQTKGVVKAEVVAG